MAVWQYHLLIAVLCFLGLHALRLALGFFFRSKNKDGYSWPKQVFIALDQALNAFARGWADETFSARCWRCGRVSLFWRCLRLAIDFFAVLLFWDKDHCLQSYASEWKRNQLPPEYRAPQHERYNYL